VCEALPCPCSRASGSGGHDFEGFEAPVPAGGHLKARIVRDVDGDTVFARYSNGAEGYVRLIGIDTPEDVRPDTPVECGAKAAAGSMTAMAAGRPALLVTDPSQDRFDRYGRLLAYVQVGGVDVGKRQIRRGWAMPYVYDDNPFRRYVTYLHQQIKAKSESRGVWGRCGGEFHSSGD
jgi:micrococcal nuclease